MKTPVMLLIMHQTLAEALGPYYACLKTSLHHFDVHTLSCIHLKDSDLEVIDPCGTLPPYSHASSCIFVSTQMTSRPLGGLVHPFLIEASIHRGN